jgi:hypothetical protein
MSNCSCIRFPPVVAATVPCHIGLDGNVGTGPDVWKVTKSS